MSSYLNQNGLPRGLRNNNPGNIRKGQPWQGRIIPGNDPAFDQFQNLAYGIRAMMMVLYAYMTKHNLLSIAGIVNRYAPLGDSTNNPNAYINYVASALRRNPSFSGKWTKREFIELCKKMVDIEIGSSYNRTYIPDRIYESAFSLLPQHVQNYYGADLSPAPPAMAKINWLIAIILISAALSKL